MTPMKKLLIIAAGCALLLATARESQALWQLSEVTPTAPISSNRIFSVTTKPTDKPSGAFLQVRITVKPEGKELLSPYLSGHVTLSDGQRVLGEIDVDEERVGESSVFSLKLDPEIARHSHFELSEPIYLWKKGQTTRPDRYAPLTELRLPGGKQFHLDLGKFIGKR
jgi:hypothetical protein